MNDQKTSYEKRDTEEAPLVSIIIPVYNVKSYLAQCLESVIRRSFHHPLFQYIEPF